MKKRLDTGLQSAPGSAITSFEEEEFWNPDLGQWILTETDAGISLEADF